MILKCSSYIELIATAGKRDFYFHRFFETDKGAIGLVVDLLDVEVLEEHVWIGFYAIGELAFRE